MRPVCRVCSPSTCDRAGRARRTSRRTSCRANPFGAGVTEAGRRSLRKRRRTAGCPGRRGRSTARTASGMCRRPSPAPANGGQPAARHQRQVLLPHLPPILLGLQPVVAGDGGECAKRLKIRHGIGIAGESLPYKSAAALDSARMAPLVWRFALLRSACDESYLHETCAAAAVLAMWAMGSVHAPLG